VILADVQDNPGGGGSADTTGILRSLIEAKATNAVVGILCDPAAAAAAHAAGEGQEVEIGLGGHTPTAGVEPLYAHYKVQKLGSGQFRTSGAVAGGLDVDLGPMALLAVDGTEIVVSSKRMQALDLEPFRHLGVEPAERNIVVVKSAVHFRAEFEPIAEQVLLVAAPGEFADNPEEYPYRRLRKTVRLRPCG
jgi:microcystin degradation protein MlrC